jgi:hypothetical protein
MLWRLPSPHQTLRWSRRPRARTANPARAAVDESVADVVAAAVAADVMPMLVRRTRTATVPER